MRQYFTLEWETPGLSKLTSIGRQEIVVALLLWVALFKGLCSKEKENGTGSSYLASLSPLWPFSYGRLLTFAAFAGGVPLVAALGAALGAVLPRLALGGERKVFLAERVEAPLCVARPFVHVASRLVCR